MLYTSATYTIILSISVNILKQSFLVSHRIFTLPTQFDTENLELFVVNTNTMIYLKSSLDHRGLPGPSTKG